MIDKIDPQKGGSSSLPQLQGEDAASQRQASELKAPGSAQGKPTVGARHAPFTLGDLNNQIGKLKQTEKRERAQGKPPTNGNRLALTPELLGGAIENLKKTRMQEFAPIEKTKPAMAGQPTSGKRFVMTRDVLGEALQSLKKTKERAPIAKSESTPLEQFQQKIFEIRKDIAPEESGDNLDDNWSDFEGGSKAASPKAMDDLSDSQKKK
ncbi:hypothetical protein ACJJI3_03285 [Microbulbifer sp. ZKSA004]|uniref:hypothetical protein n=1 Tax=Microbulbifer sp. ZKSA004 TaxID=3243389 RepID=UPI00403A6F39